MAEIGKTNTLKILRETEIGVFLDGGEYSDILLPKRYVPPGKKTGDMVEVFVYLDSEDRFIATTEKPLAEVGDIVSLKVVAVNRVGAFLDWGLPKDLLVPFAEQQEKMEKGKSYVVRVFLDEKSNRIAASSKLNKALDKTAATYMKGQQVDLLIVSETDLGYKATINGEHWGVLYHSEVFQKLRVGQKLPGYIQKIRPDNKIDLSLQKPGYDRIAGLTLDILNLLETQGGFIPLNDKSKPEEISRRFGVSKKAWKQAIGALYKQRLITIETDGIRLTRDK